MLKKLFSAGSRTSKKYQQQFSAGDSEQRLRVLQELQDAITTGELAEIGPELNLTDGLYIDYFKILFEINSKNMIIKRLILLK